MFGFGRSLWIVFREIFFQPLGTSTPAAFFVLEALFPDGSIQALHLLGAHRFGRALQIGLGGFSWNRFLLTIGCAALAQEAGQLRVSVGHCPVVR